MDFSARIGEKLPFLASRQQRESLAFTAGHFAVAAAILLLGIVYGFAWFAPAVGSYHDDGIYLTTARALAEGRGYRIVSLPNEILQTKYPFIFPALLSLFWRMFPAFPQNVTLLKTLPLVSALSWFAFTYKLLRRMDATSRQALWIVMLTAGSPFVIFLSTNLMSETLFGGLFSAALLASALVEEGGSEEWAWAAGLLAALAVCTRTVGIALLIGIPVAFAIERHVGAVWRFLLSGTVMASFWPVWLRYAQASSMDVKQGYYTALNYSSWNIWTNFSVAEKLHVLSTNTLLSLASPALLLCLPKSIWFVLLSAILLVVSFLAKLWSPNSVHLCVVAYIAVILGWAWPPERFIVIVLPFLLLLVWRAVIVLTPNRTLRSLALAAVGLVFTSLLVNDIQSISATRSDGAFPIERGLTNKWSERLKLFNWLRTNTPDDAVVLANLDPQIFLYTGRKSIRVVDANSYQLFYAPNAPTTDSIRPLEEIIQQTHASFLVLTPDRGFAEVAVLRRQLEGYLADHPGKLKEMNRPDADPAYKIFEIVR